MESTMGIRQGAGMMAYGGAGEFRKAAQFRTGVRGWVAEDCDTAERDWTAENSWKAEQVKPPIWTGRRESGRMKEAGKMYPVYAWHAEELMRVHAIADRIVARHGGPMENEKVRAIRRIRGRLQQVADLLLSSESEIAYVNGRDMELVRKTAAWLEAHPDAQ